MTSLRKIKLKLSAPKPRNPLVAPTVQRKAGAHKNARKPTRQEARRSVEKALKEAD